MTKLLVQMQIPLPLFFESYVRYTTGELVALTHETGGPWHIVYTAWANDNRLSPRIPNELIRAYFLQEVRGPKNLWESPTLACVVCSNRCYMQIRRDLGVLDWMEHPRWRDARSYLNCWIFRNLRSLRFFDSSPTDRPRIKRASRWFGLHVIRADLASDGRCSSWSRDGVLRPATV